MSQERSYTNEWKIEKMVVSSMVERLVYTEAAESSNPSLPRLKRGKKKKDVWVAQVVEHQVEGLIVGSSSLPPDKMRVTQGSERSRSYASNLRVSQVI